MPIGKNVVYIVQSESTIDGEVVKELSFQQLLYWLDVLTRNDVKFKVLYRLDHEAKQLEFNFA